MPEKVYEKDGSSMDGRMNVSDQGIIQMVNHAAIATVQGLAVFMGCRYGLESLTNGYNSSGECRYDHHDNVRLKYSLLYLGVYKSKVLYLRLRYFTLPYLYHVTLYSVISVGLDP